MHPSVWLSPSELWLLILSRFCPTVQALRGPCTIFFSIQETSNYIFITSLVHFISDHESGRVFNRLSNRALRRFVALTTVSMILNISNPSIFCLILNNSEHNTVTFSPLSGSWNGRPRAPRSTSSRRPAAARGANMPTAVAACAVERRRCLRADGERAAWTKSAGGCAAAQPHALRRSRRLDDAARRCSAAVA